MQLTVIILNYNVRYFLEQCVLSVQKALENLDAEIIVVDNNSSDDSCAMMKQLFPNIKLIENKENLGFPKGNNIAVAEAKGEFICILNPDTVVAEDSFDKILNTTNWEQNTGILGCKLIDGSGKFLPESKRGVPTPWVAITKIFGLYKVSSWFGKYYAQHLKENQSGKVDILVGAFMVIKKELYEKVGGFDENCFMYSDDIDLSYLILKEGKQNYYFADTTVIHYKGESTIRDAKYIKRFSEAMQFFYQKHFSPNLVFNTFMQIGSWLFSIFKAKQQNKKLIFKPEKTIIITTNSFLKINVKRNCEIAYCFDLKLFKEDSQNPIEIIFDTSTINFKEIITFMERNKNSNWYFKNFISGSEFIIGSLNSNDRGEIEILKKN